MLAILQTTLDFNSLMQQAAQFIMPEIILTVFACAALILDAMLPRDRKKVVAWVCLAGIGLALCSVIILSRNSLGFDFWPLNFKSAGTPRTAFFDMIVLDTYAVVFKLMFLIG